MPVSIGKLSIRKLARRAGLIALIIAGGLLGGALTPAYSASDAATPGSAATSATR